MTDDTMFCDLCNKEKSRINAEVLIAPDRQEKMVCDDCLTEHEGMRYGEWDTVDDDVIKQLCSF